MAAGASIKFHYERRGAGDDPVLLMLHGFMGSTADWSDDITAPLISAGLQLLLIDLPGHGKTVTESDNDYSFQNCAAGLLCLLDDLHLESAHLLGYSMGGRLALYMAVRYPDRFDRVVLESASPGLKTESERKARIEQDAALAASMTSQPFERFLRAWYKQPLFSSVSTRPDVLNEIIARRLANNPESLGRSLRGMGTGAQPSLWEELSALSSPLLLLVGKKDAKFTLIGREMADLCPAASLKIVGDAGHNVHLERPHEFATLVREFLST